jgi:predicted nucleotidyltransferase
MFKIKNPSDLIEGLRETLGREKDILFAYLYGSAMYDPNLSMGDIDVAVYLKAADMNQYIRKEEELTAFLASKLHTDEIDLRILNALPLVLKYSILKDGKLLFSRDELHRVDFETSVMIRFLDLKPYLDEYRMMLSQRIRGAE